MTPSAFLAHVQSLGGQVYIKGDDLGFRMPKGQMTDELRALWQQLKLDVKWFVIRGWEAEERWSRYRSQHTQPAWCTSCAAEIAVFPWEDSRTVLCLDCARQHLREEDEEEDPLIAAVLQRINAMNTPRRAGEQQQPLPVTEEGATSR
jgi:hypothetical protein